MFREIRDALARAAAVAVLPQQLSADDE